MGCFDSDSVARAAAKTLQNRLVPESKFGWSDKGIKSVGVPNDPARNMGLCDQYVAGRCTASTAIPSGLVSRLKGGKHGLM